MQFLKGMMSLVKPAADQQRIQLEFQSNKTSWPVRFDAGKLEKVLFNLLSHSLEMTPEKGRVSVLAQLDAGTVQLVIQDTGIGTPRMEQPVASESLVPFGSEVATRLPWLRLALAQELIRLQGGTFHLG